MTKIYYRQSGSADSDRFVSYTVEEAKTLLKKALEEHRILKNLRTNQRVFDIDLIEDNDVIRVLPIVGGG